MKTDQKWQCPVCGWTYRPALPALEVLCEKQHGRDNRQMILVEGSLPKRKKDTSGKQQVRRS